MMISKPLYRSFAVMFLITNLFLTYTAVSVEKINQLDGFGNLKWGTAIKTLKNMELVKSGKTSQGEIKIYRNTKDTLKYGGIELSGIEYGFSNDKLYFVALKTQGTANWMEIKEQAIKDYGQDYSKIDDFGYQNYVWHGPESSIALEYKPKQNSSVVLLMVSN